MLPVGRTALATLGLLATGAGAAMPAATSAQTAPAVNTVAFTTRPDTDSTFSLAERIGIRVFFDGNIVVTGSPR